MRLAPTLLPSPNLGADVLRLSRFEAASARDLFAQLRQRFVLSVGFLHLLPLARRDAACANSLAT